MLFDVWQNTWSWVVCKGLKFIPHCSFNGWAKGLASQCPGRSQSALSGDMLSSHMDKGLEKLRGKDSLMKPSFINRLSSTPTHPWKPCFPRLSLWWLGFQLWSLEEHIHSKTWQKGTYVAISSLVVQPFPNCIHGLCIQEKEALSLQLSCCLLSFPPFSQRQVPTDALSGQTYIINACKKKKKKLSVHFDLS